MRLQISSVLLLAIYLVFLALSESAPAKQEVLKKKEHLIWPPFSGKCPCKCLQPTIQNQWIVASTCARIGKPCRKARCLPGVAPPPGVQPVFDITCCDFDIAFPWLIVGFEGEHCLESGVSRQMQGYMCGMIFAVEVRPSILLLWRSSAIFPR